MTYRERRERKAERLREWADKREAKATSAFARSNAISDMMPMGQPILVGHHSEKRHRRDVDRIHSGMSQGIENSRKADEFRSRADNIESACDRAIYDDDPDAIERLREKLAGLEAKREAYKATNKTHVSVGESRWQPCKIGKVLSKRTGFVTVEFGEGIAEEVPRSKVHPALASYVLQNLGGVITATRKRLESLERQSANDAARDKYESDGATIAPTVNRDYVEIAFPAKPEREIIDELKAAGFWWVGKRGCWTGAVARLPSRYVREGVPA